MELDILPLGTAAWLCTKDKYNKCSALFVKPKQKPNSEYNANCCLPKPPYCQTHCWQQFYHNAILNNITMTSRAKIVSNEIGKYFFEYSAFLNGKSVVIVPSINPKIGM